MSLRKDIRDRVLLELNAAPRPDDVPAATGRRWSPGMEMPEPIIQIFCIEEPVNIVGGRSGAVANRGLQLAVQCMVSTSTPAISDDVLEPMLEHVIQRLGDTKLNGLVTSFQEERTTWEVAKVDRYYLSAMVIFGVDYQTKRNNLSAKQ